MPFVLIFAGVILLIAGTRNTQGDLYSLLAHDFTGPQNFVYWMLAIMLIGAIGYIPKLKPLSDGFLILVILVLFIHNKGFFAEFTRQIAALDTATPTAGQGQGQGGLQLVGGGGPSVGINLGGSGGSGGSIGIGGIRINLPKIGVSF